MGSEKKILGEGGGGGVIYFIGLWGQGQDSVFIKKCLSFWKALPPGPPPHYSHIFSIYSFRLRTMLVSVSQNRVRNSSYSSGAAGIFLRASTLVYGPCMKCSVAFGIISNSLTLL